MSKTTQEDLQDSFQSTLNESISVNQTKEESDLEDSDAEQKIEDETKKLLKQTGQVEEQELPDAPMSFDYDVTDSQTIIDMKQTQDLGRTLIHQCCLDQNHQILTMHIQKINKASQGNISVIREILEMKDDFGNTPLMLSLIYDKGTGTDSSAEST